jgi:hypothetical protein
MELFNLELIKRNFSGEVFWAFDPSYLNKSGKKSYGVGHFWSGCAQSVKWGLEFGNLAAIGVQEQTALHYKAVQTPGDLKQGTQLEHYANVLKDEKESLQSVSKIVVADAFFSKKAFVDTMLGDGFSVISRFRKDVNLFYLYLGPPKGAKDKNKGKGKGSGGGRPKMYDGKVDFKNLDPQYFVPCYQDGDEIAYEAVVQAKALGRTVRVVVLHKLDKDGRVKSSCVYFSSDPSISGADILLYYHLRFQQEFIFRDAKQHVGLNDCQARSKEQLDFHVNLSMTTVNIAKAYHHLNKEDYLNQPFSMADIKTQYFNELMIGQVLDVFIEVSGVNPDLIKNNPKVLKLSNIGKITA